MTVNYRDEIKLSEKLHLLKVAGKKPRFGGKKKTNFGGKLKLFGGNSVMSYQMVGGIVTLVTFVHCNAILISSVDNTAHC